MEACALDRDLKALGKGDLTRVGERGVSISGGQKQRITLARAVYSNAGHLLLDDCLSAVDSHTATSIFTKCLKGPLVKGRTVVLATYNIALTEADAALVVILGEGKVVALSGPEAKRSTKVSQSEDFAGEDTEPIKVSSDAMSYFELSIRPVQLEKGSLETIQQEIADDSYEDASKSEETDDDSVSWRSVSLYLRAMGGWTFWPLVLSLSSANSSEPLLRIGGFECCAMHTLPRARRPPQVPRRVTKASASHTTLGRMR